MSRTEGQVVTGVVKYYSIDKGYGFITCDDGGGDCFVHQSAILTDAFRALPKGHKVSFKYTLRQGKDTATEVQPEPALHYENKLEASKAMMRADRDPDALDGTVKWFNTQKGFGFIIPSVGEKEVFVHIGQIEGQVPLMEGDEVEYKVTVDEEKDRHTAIGVRLTGRNGQPVQARGAGAQVQPVYAQPQYQAVESFGGQFGFAQQQAPAQPQVSPQVQAMLAPGQMSGTCKWFNEQKGFGFIVTATGQDMYVNRAQLQMCGGSLTQGETVIYETQTNNGKTWATNVSRPTQQQQQPQYMYVQQQPQVQYAQAQPEYGQPGQFAVVGSKRKLAEAPVGFAKTARPKFTGAPAQQQYQQLPQGYVMEQVPAQVQYVDYAPQQQQQQQQEQYYYPDQSYAQ